MQLCENNEYVYKWLSDDVVRVTYLAPKLNVRNKVGYNSSED